MPFIQQQKKQIKQTLLFFYLFLILIVLIRYYKLQLIDHDTYKTQGEKNSLVARVLNAPRGIVFDRNGIPLVDNKFIYDINIIPDHFDRNNFTMRIPLSSCTTTFSGTWSCATTQSKFPIMFVINIPIKFYDNYDILENAAKINKNYIDSIISHSMKSADKFRPQLIKRHVNFKIKSVLEENKLNFKGMYFSQFPIRTFTSSCNLPFFVGL